MKPVDQLTFRLATPEDCPAVRNCVDAAYTPYMATIGVRPGPLFDDYHGLISERHVRVAVEPDGRIVGAFVSFERDDYVLLDNAAILPDWQNNGVGQRFLESVVEEARPKGYTRYRLYTHAKMTNNIATYRHLGFVEVERKTEKGFDRVYMEKIIV